MDAVMIAALHSARAAEKAQALFYRALAAEAAERGDDTGVDRLNGLHADEQHHLSRISARLLELGEGLIEVGGTRAERVPYEEWETHARTREEAEIVRYEQLTALPADEPTSALLREILGTERNHARELGGKWTPA